MYAVFYHPVCYAEYGRRNKANYHGTIRKIISVTKKQGLSQEQLAEQLNVSRQAISKWESGTAMPESEKLLAISNYFQVSLDYLMKSDSDSEDPNSSPANKTAATTTESSSAASPPGIILSIGGVLALCIWGLLSMLRPETSAQLGQSSMVTIDGNGIFLLLCVAAIVFGAWLLLKGRSSK